MKSPAPNPVIETGAFRNPPKFVASRYQLPEPFTGQTLPPYGFRLAAALAQPDSWRRYSGTSADGRRPTIWLLAGPDCWAVGRRWAARADRLFCLLPPGEAPTRYNWRLLAAIDSGPILVLLCGELPQDDIKALVVALGTAGVRSVHVVGVGHYYVQEARHGS